MLFRSNGLLVPHYGVHGIVMATVLAAAVSAGYLLFVMHKPCGLIGTQVALLLASWLAMAGLCASMYFKSGAGAVISIVVMLLLLSAQWRTWQREGGAAMGVESTESASRV